MTFVCLVEDNEPDADLIQRAATEAWPQDVQLIWEPDRAMAAKRTDQGEFAAMIIDLILGKPDGMSLLRHIRGNARTATLPVIVLSGAKTDESFRDFYGSNGTLYLTKPDDYDGYVETLRIIGHFLVALFGSRAMVTNVD